MLSESSSSSDSDIYLPGFFALPIDCKIMDSKTVYQAYRGQLEITIKINYGVLTVHIVRGRNLHSEEYITCDSYINISLNPDPSERTLCHTDPIVQDNNPLFDEKFSFELLEDDVDKRLYISIFNRVAHKREDEFLGAMSFGLHNIVSEIKGWFYLLMGELGTSKHLRYTGKKNPGIHISSINADVKWMDSYSMILKKNRGFGFSLNGNSPVYVSRVNSGSAAEECGLKKGDCFVRIGGMNVSRSSADSVARILRQCGASVKLEVQRPREQGSNRPAAVRTSDRDLSPHQRIEKLSVSPWKPSRRNADGNSRPTSYISQMVSSSSHENLQIIPSDPRQSLYMPMTSSKMMNRAPQPLPCHAYQQPQPRPLSVAGGGASQYHQAHRQRPLSSVIGVKQQQQLLQQRPLSSVIGVKQQQQQLLQQQHKPQRPLSTMFDGCVDYGWVDSDGYVQRTGASATLPRNHGGQALKPQRSAEQVPLTYHQHHHHSQHVASMSSRPSSYQSAEEPHYEVIEDSYYYNRGGGRQGQQQQQQRAGYVRKERYVSSTDMDVTPLSPPPPPPPPATHADRRGTFTKAEVHRAPVPVTLTSDLDEGHSFSRSSLSKSEQDLLQAQAEFHKNYELSPSSPRITRYMLNTPRAPFSSIDTEELLYKRSDEINELSKRFYNRAYELQNLPNSYKMPKKTPIRPIMQRYRESCKENPTMI